MQNISNIDLAENLLNVMDVFVYSTILVTFLMSAAFVIYAKKLKN